MFKRSAASAPDLLSPRKRTATSDRTRVRKSWLRLFAACLLIVVTWQISKLLLTGRQLHPWFFNQAGQETVHWSWRDPKCPLEYRRHDWSDIKMLKKKPYLFGGQQEPICKNCEVDALWSNFCRFRSHVSFSLQSLRHFVSAMSAASCQRL